MEQQGVLGAGAGGRRGRRDRNLLPLVQGLLLGQVDLVEVRQRPLEYLQPPVHIQLREAPARTRVAPYTDVLAEHLALGPLVHGGADIVQMQLFWSMALESIGTAPFVLLAYLHLGSQIYITLDKNYRS